MPKKRSISDIKSNLLRPSLSSHFEVEIGLPNAGFVQRLLGANQDQLNLMCSEASLPGSQLTTLDIKDDFTGVSEKHAYRRQFDDRIDLTFYVDAQNYLPIRFFEAWIRFITDEDNEMKNDGKNPLDPTYSYRMRYSNEYAAAGLKVIKFERDYSSSLEYEFVKSYPLSISSMPVSYESSSLLKCTVSMTYIRYVTRPGNPSNSNPSSLTPAGFAQANDLLTTIGGIPRVIANAAGNAISDFGESISNLF
tara:strand:+ start:2161 stop:2910 length:750 start_codon:yes stop_codon:yes gene_type:complete